MNENNLKPANLTAEKQIMMTVILWQVIEQLIILIIEASIVQLCWNSIQILQPKLSVGNSHKKICQLVNEPRRYFTTISGLVYKFCKNEFECRLCPINLHYSLMKRELPLLLSSELWYEITVPLWLCFKPAEAYLYPNMVISVSMLWCSWLLETKLLRHLCRVVDAKISSDVTLSTSFSSRKVCYFNKSLQ